MVLITIAGYISAIGCVYCAITASKICTSIKNDYIVGAIVCAIAATICSIVLI